MAANSRPGGAGSSVAGMGAVSYPAEIPSTPMILQRLGGIEDELKELRGLMAQLVRVEERSNADRAEIARLGLELATMRNQIMTLTERSMTNGFTVGAVKQAVIIVSTAAAAALVGWLSRGGG